MNPIDLLPGLEQVQMFALLMGALDVARASIQGIAQNVMNQIAPTVYAILVLYVILYGAMLMNGAIKETLHDVMVRVFKLGFVIWFAFNSIDYIGYAVLYVWTLPEELIAFLLPPNLLTTVAGFATLGFGSTTTSIDIAAGLVATMASSLLSIVNTLLQAASTAGGGLNTLHILATGLGVVATGLTAVTLGALVVAKVSLAILLGLGPVFIPMILFKKTQPYFDGWVAQIFNYVLVLLLMSVAIYILFPVLLVMIATYYALSAAVGLTVTDGLQLTALIGIFIAVMKQVPSTAASISRGYAVGLPQDKAPANAGQRAREAGQ